MNLSDCGSPILDIRAATNRRASSLRTSDRASLLRFFGFPLNLFGKARPPAVVELCLARMLTV